jgi:hypothetical protein
MMRRKTITSPKATIRSAVVPDCSSLARVLRDADIAEVKASSGLSPGDALLRAYVLSHDCFTVEDSTGPVCMFGVVRDSKTTGRIWLLGSDRMFLYRRQLLTEPRLWLDHWRQKYKVLTNFVDARNVRHVRWLEHMGCRFIREVPDFGHEKRIFKEFVYV